MIIPLVGDGFKYTLNIRELSVSYSLRDSETAALQVCLDDTPGGGIDSQGWLRF